MCYCKRNSVEEVHFSSGSRFSCDIVDPRPKETSTFHSYNSNKKINRPSLRSEMHKKGIRKFKIIIKIYNAV